MRVHRDVFGFFFIFFNLNYRNDGVQRLLEHLVCTFSRSKQWIEQVALQSDLGSNTFVMPTYGLVRKHLFDVKPLIKKDQINKCDFKNHWNVLLCCFASNQISNSGLVVENISVHLAQNLILITTGIQNLTKNNKTYIFFSSSFFLFKSITKEVKYATILLYL